MASSNLTARRSTASQRGSPAPAGAPTRRLGWIPIALGGAAIVAGLGGRRRGAAALALTALAGAGALGAMRRDKHEQGKTGGEPEVERAITIGKSADELRRYWLDPRTLPQIAAGFAAVRASGDGRLHWTLEGPLGRVCEWDTETIERGDDGIGWRAMPGGAVATEAWVRFHPAPAGRGTVVTLRWRFAPPGGALGEWILELLGSAPLRVAADGLLRRFKNLVETGEIPTTAPACRSRRHTLRSTRCEHFTGTA